MIHLNNESLCDIREKLQAGMARWNASQSVTGRLAIEPPYVRHVSPEKQSIYVSTVLTTVNLPSLLEMDESTPAMALKDQLMALIVRDSPLGNWLSSFFMPTDIVELTVANSEVRVSTDSSDVFAKLVRPGIFSLLYAAPPVPRGYADAAPVAPREYIAPMGLSVTYDAMKNRLNFTLKEDSSHRFLNDPGIEDPSVEVVMNFGVCLRLTLRPDMEVEFMRRIMLLQQEQIRSLTTFNPHGTGGAYRPRFRMEGARSFHHSRFGGDPISQDLSIWLAVALKDSAARPESYGSTQECVDARAMERFGQSPIQHSSRPGEGYNLQRSYAVEAGGAHLVGDVRPEAGDPHPAASE